MPLIQLNESRFFPPWKVGAVLREGRVRELPISKVQLGDLVIFPHHSEEGQGYASVWEEGQICQLIPVRTITRK